MHDVCNIEDSPFYVFRACARGLLNDVDRLLTEDPDRATAKDTKGWTCMHHAASRDKVPIMDLILKYSSETLNAINVDGDTPLHLAAQNGKKNAVGHLLKLGANPNLVNLKKDAPLHLAARNSHHTVIKELRDCNRTNIDVRNKNGSFAIHIAARYDLVEVAGELVAGMCELFQPNFNGFYPIHLAANNASKRALEIILTAAESRGVSREQMFGFLDAENNSPLHSAVNGGHAEAVAVCLENGARVEARSDDGSTPFHLACNQGAASIVRLMLDSYRRSHGSVDGLLDLVDIIGHTPLHRASMFGHPDVVCILIQEGATLEMKDNDGRTPVLVAAAKGSGNCLRLLMEAGASVTVRDMHSRNVFHFIVAHGTSMTGELRLIYESPKGRALLNQQDEQGCTPLHMATRQGNLAFIDSLLNLGATIGTKNNDDQSALHFAARYGRLNTVRRLLDHSGTIINETDGLGMTPLHVASVNGHTKVVTLLLKRGALVHKDFHGQTPLHLSAQRNYTRTVKLLLSYHINLLDLTDKKRNTALHVAAAQNRAEAVDQLLEMGASYKANLESKTPLDLCIQGHCTEAALAMVHSERWNEFLEYGSSVYGSPLLGLIQFLPHVHKAVLDRCLTSSRAHPASKLFWERYDFRHMEPAKEMTGRLGQYNRQMSVTGKRDSTMASTPRSRESLLCLNVRRRKR